MQISKCIHEPHVLKYMEISWYSTTHVKVPGKIHACTFPMEIHAIHAPHNVDISIYPHALHM